MEDAAIFDSLRAALRLALTLSLPILGASLAVGLVIGLMQAMTSVQEMTLTFVPKLAVILVVFWMTMGHSAQALQVFFEEVVLRQMVF
ncbi:MAG: flagellar biosynthetic protein FliQ [Pseudomonadota bacterium]